MRIINVENKDKRFVLDWYEEFGWKANPFETTIYEPVNKFVAGFEDEIIKINSFIINKNKFGTFHGDIGSGKSTLLKLIQVDLKKYQNKLIVLYADLNKVKSEKQILNTLIKHFMTLFERLFKKPQDVTGEDIYEFINSRLSGRRIVLLLDNIGSITENIKLLINNLKKLDIQFIAADTKENITKSNIKSLFDMDYLDMELMGLEADDAYTMIEKRIKSVGGESIHPLDSNMIKAITASSMNPNAILKQAYELSLKHSLWNVQSKRLQTDEEDEYAEDVSNKIEYEIEEPQKPVTPLPQIEEPFEFEPLLNKEKKIVTNTPSYLRKDISSKQNAQSYLNKDIRVKPKEESQPRIKNIATGYNTPKEHSIDAKTKEFEDILKDIEL